MRIVRVVGEATVVRPGLRSLTEYTVGWGLVVAALLALPRPLDFGAVALGIPALLQLLRKTKTRVWLSDDQLIVRSPSGETAYAAGDIAALPVERGRDGVLRLSICRADRSRVRLPLPDGGFYWTRDRQAQTQAIRSWWVGHREDPGIEPRPSRSWRRAGRG